MKAEEQLTQKLIMEAMEQNGLDIYNRLKEQGFYICRSGAVHYIKDKEGKTLIYSFSVPALFRDLYIIMR